MDLNNVMLVLKSYIERLIQIFIFYKNNIDCTSQLVLITR